MEPAMIACGGVAAFSLGWWLVIRARSKAVATVILALVSFAAIPRDPVAAEPIPPIVRLADEHGEQTSPGSTSPIPATATYLVQRGDSLWCIAAATLDRRTGSRPTVEAIAQFWPRIYAASQAVVGDDPDLILPGQHLTIPGQ